MEPERIIPGRSVYVVDDESHVRRALTFALRTAGFEARPFATGRDFLAEVPALAPGCVLLDLRMPEPAGFTILDELASRRQRYPVVVITGHGDLQTAVQAMKRGAKDFLQKPFSDEAMLEAIDAVFANFPNDVEADLQRSRAIALVETLTPRELQLLKRLVSGLPNKGVANELGISVRTVEMHRGNLLNRLGVHSLAEAVKVALLAGLPPP